MKIITQKIKCNVNPQNQEISLIEEETFEVSSEDIGELSGSEIMVQATKISQFNAKELSLTRTMSANSVLRKTLIP